MPFMLRPTTVQADLSKKERKKERFQRIIDEGSCVPAETPLARNATAVVRCQLEDL